MTISHRIRDLREDRDWRQEHLADLLHVTRTSCGAYENGVSEFSPEHLLQLAEIHQSSVDDQRGLTDGQKPYPRKKKR